MCVPVLRSRLAGVKRKVLLKFMLPLPSMCPQKYGLRQIFEAVLVTTQSIVSKGALRDDTPDIHVFKSCLHAFETVLTWEFVTGEDFVGRMKNAPAQSW